MDISFQAKYQCCQGTTQRKENHVLGRIAPGIRKTKEVEAGNHNKHILWIAVSLIQPHMTSDGLKQEQSY